jgi:hypothetical protein
VAKKKKSKPSLMTTVTAPIKKVGEFIADHMPTVGAAKPTKKKTAKKKKAAPKAAAPAPAPAAKPAKKKTAKKKKK